MRALPCTKHRHAMLLLVDGGTIITMPAARGWQWRRRNPDALLVDGIGAHQSLTSSQSKTLGELFDAKLIRISKAAPRSGWPKGLRAVFLTAAGRVLLDRGARASRGCSNTNSRGNSQARRRRRQWLLDTFGDGTSAACWLAVPDVCAGPVTFETVSVERVTPGHAGGTYRRDNIRPACSPCQSNQGGRFAQERLRGRTAVRRARELISS